MLIVGGGAAGYFAAIACAERNPKGVSVTLAESARTPLGKVRISGGGRCNVTHHAFDPSEFMIGYPRGGRELRGPFSRFQARDTMAWFESRGIPLKTEPDGRVFPVSDQSETIVNCLEKAAADAGVFVRLNTGVRGIKRVSSPAGEAGFEVEFGHGERARFERVLLATGSAPGGYELARSLGHTIQPCVPSLFTFEVRDKLIEGLAGVSFPDARLTLGIEGKKPLEQRGALLITHWGLSGPAVINLSAWGARVLHESKYRAVLRVNWLAEHDEESLLKELLSHKESHPKRSPRSGVGLPLPQRFWERIVELANLPDDLTWANVSKGTLMRIASRIADSRLSIAGKGEFKEEFVTCGGVTLKEADFKTMGSRISPGLHFAGEILDIDGVTGGYNLQCAWTTGWIAGQAMGGKIE